MNSATLMWGLVFGSIGFGFFLYGKKQQVIAPLLCGIGLMAAPYIVKNPYLLVLSGVVLMGVPYFFRR